MSHQHPDLFGAVYRCRESPAGEVVQIVRTQLHQTLRLVKSAEVMPWSDPLDVIRADNGFRYGKEALPSAEAAALWAEFNVEMDRLYAVSNKMQSVAD